MPESISEVFRVRERFLRSTHLERDFEDSSALSGYVVTPQTRGYLLRLSSGLKDTSGQRAWRITGDFGTGKSSFALFTAHLFGGRRAELPKRLRDTVRFSDFQNHQPRLLPVLITGSREPLAIAILRSLHRSLSETCKRGRVPSVLERIAAELHSTSVRISEDRVVSLLTEASAYVSSANKGTGILLILDELGKFLEFASINPDRDDVFLLQRLAEAASRSGKTPIFVLGILHQGFSAYSNQLSQSAQKEWEKVASRFEELIFDQPLEQTTILVADALNVRANKLPTSIERTARSDMRSLLKLGWYGPAYTKDILDNAARIYPLHPSVLPVLVKLFSRFGQNERSLFSFLISNEPYGLQEFAARSINTGDFYRIHNLYDYARAAFGHRLGVQSYRSHWNQISSLVDSFPASETHELEVLKTVGLLNMLDATNLVASEDIIHIACVGNAEKRQGSVKEILNKLQKTDRVLYHRGSAGGYCLWPHTSVNLEKAYEDASRSLGNVSQAVAPHLQRYLETRPIVARRHYIETGNLRHFEVVFSPVRELSAHTRLDYAQADGRIIVALCETESERIEALEFAGSEALSCEPSILLAIPKPLGVLGKLFEELQRWEWISRHVPELNSDTFASEEVNRQIEASRELLGQRVHSFIGLKEFNGKSGLQWFRQNEALNISGGRQLLSYLSHVFDGVYHSAPIVSNELINRRSLSSAAAAARMRLMEGVFGAATKPYLGVDPSKKPPEMSMYLSLFKEGNIHLQGEEGFRIVVPPARSDTCKLRPTLKYLLEFLKSQPDKRVKLSEVFSAMRSPPYGVRDGLAPLLLAIFASVHEQSIAFYDKGVFMRQMSSLDLMRLVKVPEDFEIQFCQLSGVRSDLFDRLIQVLGIRSFDRNRTDLLDVVRPLCVFAAELPAYTRKTGKLTERTAMVRRSLLTAREPARLLFEDLPKACGYSPFLSTTRVAHGQVEHFAEALRESMAELKAAYPELQARMKNAIVESFDLDGGQLFPHIREILAQRARPLLIGAIEPRIKAFCHRLTDLQLPEDSWMESLGSLICCMPPNKWADLDEGKFYDELNSLSARFRRLESISFPSDIQSSSDTALRVVITATGGDERDRVIHISREDEEPIEKLEAELTKIISQNRRVGIAAAARAFWKVLEGEEKEVTDGEIPTAHS